MPSSTAALTLPAREQPRGTGIYGGTEHGHRDTALSAGCRTDLP